MKKKISNEEREKLLKRRVMLWYGIIVFGILTILLSILSLTIKLNPIYAIISFVLETLASYFRNKIKLEDN